MRTIITRRAILKAGGLGLAAISGLRASDLFASALPAEDAFTVPPLPYDFAALEPHIDADDGDPPR